MAYTKSDTTPGVHQNLEARLDWIEDGISTVSGAASPPTRQIFTATGTYTPSAGVVAAIAECIAAGGGGGGTPATAASGNGQCAAAGGGGGGGFSSSLILSPTSQTVTIGTGGAGGIGNNNGSAGGNTSFGSLVIAEGGQGGAKGIVDIGTFPDTSASASRGGLGANGTGDVKIDGGNGQGGMMYSVVMPSSGDGGEAARGAGRRTGSTGGTFAGNPGRIYGGGGTGASATTSAAAQTGGAGANGICIVTEYYQ